MSYLTIEQLQERATLPGIKECTDNTKLQFILDLSTKLIDAYIGFSFNPVTTDLKVLDGSGTKKLALPEKIDSLNTVCINNNYISSTEFIIVDEGKSLFYRNDIFDEGEYNVEVNGNFGWSEIPQDIELCVLLLSQGFFNTIDNEDILSHQVGPYQSEKIGNYSYQLKKKFNEITGDTIVTTGDTTVDTILDKYKVGEQFSIEVI